jgi:hypothetical protein
LSPADPTVAEGSAGMSAGGGGASGVFSGFFFFLGGSGASLMPVSSTGLTASILGGAGSGSGVGGATGVRAAGSISATCTVSGPGTTIETGERT